MTDASDTTDTDSEDELIEEIRSCFKRARAHSAVWRDEAAADYDMVSGHQWSDEDKQKMEDEGRAAVVFNRVAPVVDAVCGSEIANRQEVRYIPREIGDAAVNELLTGTAKWVRDLCDAEDEESDSFGDTVICGMGWTETHVEYDEDPQGLIYIDRVDPLEMLWDPTASKRNLSDARWVMRTKTYSREEMVEQWGDELVGQIENPDEFRSNVGDAAGEPHDATEAPFYKNDQAGRGIDREAKGYWVVEYQWTEMTAVHVVAMGGQTQEFTSAQFAKMKDELTANGIPSAKRKKRKHYRTFACGGIVLEPAVVIPGRTYNCITGKRDRNANTWYGLVRAMTDPQKWANKVFSQILHIFNTNAKGGAFVEQTALLDARKAEDEWSRPDALIMLREGGLGKIRERTLPPYPTTLDALMRYAIEAIPQTTGVNFELMGLVGRQQAGVLEMQRKQAGLTILAGLFDALRRYRKEQGRLLMLFIREYITPGRLVRINGEMGPKYQPFDLQSGALEYDVVVDDAPTSPNQKERVFQLLVQMVPLLKDIGALPPVDVLDWTPLPETLAQKWKQQIAKQGADPMAEQGKQLQMQKLAAEVAKIIADTEATKAGVITDQATVKVRAAEVMGGAVSQAHDEKAQMMDHALEIANLVHGRQDRHHDQLRAGVERGMDHGMAMREPPKPPTTVQ